MTVTSVTSQLCNQNTGCHCFDLTSVASYAYQAFYNLKYYNLQKTEFPYKETKKTNKLPHVAIQRLKALNNSDI